MRRGSSHGIWVLATTLVSCSAPDKAPRVQAGPASSPGRDDRGALCLDVADVRACWGDAADSDKCRSGTCFVRRPLPAAPAPPSGFRCRGQRGDRSCVTRVLDGPPFVCDQNRCVQAPPRMPDNGEWECVEMAGAVICRSLAEAAGIPRGPEDAAFVCGTRAGHGERICVDLSPDPPPGLASWGCRVTYDRGSAARVCTATNEPRVGGSCTSDANCPAAVPCVGGRCLPDQPKPACWFDQDCGRGARCRYGSCRAEK